jgi:tetratricopeptide (TPR) repeat protein
MAIGQLAAAQTKCRNGSSNSSDVELIKLRERISREQGKKKFELIYIYLKLLKNKKNLRDTPEAHELAKEAHRLVEEAGNDPFMKVRYLILELWMHRPEVLTVPSENKFKSDSIVNRILAFYDSAYQAGFSREDSAKYAEVLRYKATILSTCNHRDSIIKGLSYSYRSLRVYEAMEDSSNVVFELSNIGAIHYRAHNYDVAVRYTLEAIELAPKYRYDLYISLHNNLGLIYLMHKNYTEAFRLFEFAVDEFVKHNKDNLGDKLFTDGTAQFMVNAAVAAMNMNDVPKLKRYYERLENWVAQYPSDYYQTYLLFLASALAVFEGDDDKARELRRRVNEFVPQSKAYRAAAMAFFVWAEKEQQLSLIHI